MNLPEEKELKTNHLRIQAQENLAEGGKIVGENPIFVDLKEEPAPSKTDGDFLVDRSDLAPDLKQFLRLGEKIISVQEAFVPSFDSLPDWRQELARLCEVDNPKDIGQNPPVAARCASAASGQGLFECRFGRDSLVAANDLMEEFPMLARSVIFDCAKMIGMVENLRREEEFGRVYHEARKENDPVCDVAIKNGWGWPFYAAADTTPLFVNTLCDYSKTEHGKNIFGEEYTGRDGLRHSLFDALRFAMSWIAGRMNKNPQRFLEYKPAFKGSIANQVMEDSYDSHFHKDGSLPDFSQGVASTEVQGYAYDSLINAAEIYKKFGFIRDAEYFLALAQELKRQIFLNLWIKDDGGGYFAAGCDRDEFGRIRAMKVKKAIPFFLLNSQLFCQNNDWTKRIISQCVETIFSSQMLCAAGIRSLAADEPRFMPGAYHNGNSWPMQTFQIAKGLRKQGFEDLAEDLESRIVKAVELLKIYPEFVNGGFDSEIRISNRIVDTFDPFDGRKNRREQPPQQIQLWTLSAYGAIQYQKNK